MQERRKVTVRERRAEKVPNVAGLERAASEGDRDSREDAGKRSPCTRRTDSALPTWKPQLGAQLSCFWEEDRNSLVPVSQLGSRVVSEASKPARSQAKNSFERQTKLHSQCFTNTPSFKLTGIWQTIPRLLVETD